MISDSLTVALRQHGEVPTGLRATLIYGSGHQDEAGVTAGDPGGISWFAGGRRAAMSY